MNTTENNKLIAEFMGHKIDWGFNKDSILYMPQGEGNSTNNSVVIRLDELPYHTSWDWLMPVVEKIEGLGYDTEIVYRLDDGLGHRFYINDSGVHSELCESKLEATYQAVVEFIKWYNENK